MSETFGIFAGFGAMILLIVIAYFLYQFTRLWKGMADIEERYDILHLIGLNKIALKKGIDLEKEIQKRQVIKRRRRSLRRELEKEILDDFFGKEKDKS